MGAEMALPSLFGRICRVWAPTPDNPELPKAQCAALSRLAPMLYFMLVANGWVLAVRFIHRAPAWLTIYLPLLLSIIYVSQFVLWWRRRHMALTTEMATRWLRTTNRLAVALAIACSAWSLALFPYGGTAAQFHVALFLALSMVGSMMCLIHLRPAALAVVAIKGGAFVIFFIAVGTATSIAMALNVLCVTVAGMVVVLVQSADFARMVSAQVDARRREQEQSRLMHMIDDMPMAVMTVERDTLKINYANEMSKQLIRRIEHLLPIRADALLGTSIDVFHAVPEHQRGLLADPANLPHRARIRLGPEMLDLQLSAVRSDDGSYIGPMLSWEIVTKDMEAEQRIHQLAHFDTLTGLANRNTFHEELDAKLPGGEAALLFVDLDGFKMVNDSRGHRVGDLLLQQVATRLRAACGLAGTIVGRLGGDEFAILVPDGDPGRAAAMAATLIDAVSVPYRIGYDSSIRIGASVGIALAPVHGVDAETLLAHADIALYAAKAAGKCTFRLFTDEMNARIQESVRLEAELREALDTQEGLFIFYQPVIDIRTLTVTTREALMRWYHPRRGWIVPGEFIPVAEESGLIDQLGLFVLNRACRDAAGWDDEVRVAVNVSAGQLGKGLLVPGVRAALAGSGLAPGRLELEVTETALVKGEAEGVLELRQLRGIGVRVALDDFGTGYSSLAHLRAFPFDKIKIDGSFVQDAVTRPDCAAVVGAVADLGRRLGVPTVAEGVETRAHLDCVVAEGCSEVQGYLFGLPAPGDGDAPRVAALGTRAVRRGAVVPLPP